MVLRDLELRHDPEVLDSLCPRENLVVLEDQGDPSRQEYLEVPSLQRFLFVLVILNPQEDLGYQGDLFLRVVLVHRVSQLVP